MDKGAPSHLGDRAATPAKVALPVLVLLILVLGLASILPEASAGAPARSVRIGYLALVSPTTEMVPIWNAFVGRLAELGWVQGRNLVLESRYADGRAERLRALADELVRLPVDLIVASGVSAVLAAKAATSTIPIVIAGASDPVGFGLVQSLAHPGANVTGLSDSPGREIEGKRLELLKEVAPRLSRVALILDSTSRRDPEPTYAAAKTLGLTLLVSPETAAPDEFQRTFLGLTRDGAQALYAPETPVNARHRDLIVALAAKHHLPAMYGSREFVDAGGLMSYGTSFVHLYGQAATYVDRILRGARPADLPVELPSRFELAVNLRAAATLGLTMPRSVLIRVDHVVR
ncbi:MAG TPA: ABC transporter substrate-binding protein [Methylomirabilota bacterium]|nr:ABC transporter substrate-binding protein [Methylomirabilota bacterium]